MKGLSFKAKAYILGTILVGSGLMVWNILRLEPSDILYLVVLSSLASLSLVLKVEGATNRLHYNVSFLIYAFTFIVLGTPAAILVIFISNLVEWIWFRYPWYIPCFNIANLAIVMQITGLVYAQINQQRTYFDFVAILAILVSMAVFTLLNHFFVGGVIWLARGENFGKSGIFDFLPLMIDFTMLCLGAGTAIIWTLNPFASVLTLIPLYLIYNTLKVPALERESETDPKTGLFNARYFERALKTELNRAHRFDRPLTVVMADLDLLRNINNTYGHLAGDEVLKGVAKIFQQFTREYDVVARFGGEEFAIMIPESDPQQVFPRVEAMREAIEKADFTVQTSVTPIKATMSFGIAGREGFSQSPNEIVHNADAALYHSKLKGRNCTFVHTEEIYETLFNGENEGMPLPAIESLQERIQSSDLPFQPSSLREQARFPEPKPEEKPVSPVAAPRSRPKRLVNLYILGLTLIAVLLFLLTFQPLTVSSWSGLALFALLVVLTELLSIDIYLRDTSVSTSAAPMLAGVLLYGPVGALVLSVTFAIVAMIKHRSHFSRLIFNASNQMIAGLLYTGMLLLTGEPFGDWSYPIQLVLSLLAAGIVFISTTCLIAVAMHLDLGVPVKQVWKEKFSWLLPYYLGMGLIAYGLVFGYHFAGVVGVVVITVPLLLLRLSQEQYIERTRAIVKELREKNLILEENTSEITKLSEALLDTLASVIDMRNPFVLGHSRQVANLSVKIARRLGLPEKRVENIRKAGLLHDLGKLGIPDAILLKPGSLTPEEFTTIKTHPTLGSEILEATHSLSNLIPIVRHHHERFDGEGYPDGLQGHDIPLEARIVAISDAFEAMASDRPYRPALDFQQILEQLEDNSGTQFDPRVAKAMIDLMNVEGKALVVNTGLHTQNEEAASVVDPTRNNGHKG
jgi:diguanylate cyclase (GGDEF)-like protein/putative nucleotidyltransferase with HDIG domain